MIEVIAERDAQLATDLLGGQKIQKKINRIQKLWFKQTLVMIPLSGKTESKSISLRADNIFMRADNIFMRASQT